VVGRNSGKSIAASEKYQERDDDVLMMLMIKGKLMIYCDCTLPISWHLP
jgi:hypothetical protein